MNYTKQNKKSKNENSIIRCEKFYIGQFIAILFLRTKYHEKTLFYSFKH